MSVGSNLQEMENVVTKGAAKAEPMQKLSTGIAPGQTGSWEDLGGPTPENYRPDDDSAKLNTPGTTLAQVKNIVNKGAKAADAMQKLAAGAVKEETEEDEEDLISEEEVVEAAEMEDEGSEEDDAEDAKEGKKKKSKKEDDSEKEDEMKEDFNIEEDVNALLAGEDLSEEFQEKARTIFEAAIKTKVAEIKEDLQAAYEEALIEEVQAVKSELVERVDAYLEYVADEWVSENALAVEAGLKTEMTESFLSGMKGLFEDRGGNENQSLANGSAYLSIHQCTGILLPKGCKVFGVWKCPQKQYLSPIGKCRANRASHGDCRLCQYDWSRCDRSRKYGCRK